jgi:hypothetical protein
LYLTFIAFVTGHSGRLGGASDTCLQRSSVISAIRLPLMLGCIAKCRVGAHGFGVSV